MMSDFYDVTGGGLTANGSSTAVQIKQAVRDLGSSSERQAWTVFAEGTWDGATLTLEFGPSKTGPWLTDANTTFTANGAAITEMSRNTWVRATLSSAGASTDVNLYVG